jgi:hypothetical protein
MRIVAKPTKQIIKTRTEIKHPISTRLQGESVIGPQHRSTASGNYNPLAPRELAQYRFLHIPKRLLAGGFEIAANGATQNSFNLKVGVEESPMQSLRHLAADSGLSTAGHADEREGHWRGQAVDVLGRAARLIANA